MNADLTPSLSHRVRRKLCLRYLKGGSRFWLSVVLFFEFGEMHFVILDLISVADDYTDFTAHRFNLVKDLVLEGENI